MSEVGSLSSTTSKTLAKTPSIRKACDLCHQAKQKCSGDKPSCGRCRASGWNCRYTPRQRRKVVKQQVIDRFDIIAAHAKVERESRENPIRELEVPPAPTGLPIQAEIPVAGPSRLGWNPGPKPKGDFILEIPPKRECKRRRGSDGKIYNTFLPRPNQKPEGQSTSGIAAKGIVNPLPINEVSTTQCGKSRGMGGNGFVRWDEQGRETFMTATEYMECIRVDGHLGDLQLEKYLDILAPLISVLDPPISMPLSNPVGNEIENSLPQNQTSDQASRTWQPAPTADREHPMSSNFYDEQPFEEETPTIELELPSAQEDEDDSPATLHFAVEESADMRFFARSSSMPPVSSLPPLDMSSFLASQAMLAGQGSYSPKSHYLTEGLDLAASNRTPTAATFDGAYNWSRPFMFPAPIAHTTGFAPYEHTVPLPKALDPQSIIRQQSYASSPVPRSSGPISQPLSGPSTANCQFVGLGHPSTFRPPHHTLQRAHSVPQSPFPTQHFESVPHVNGPMSVMGDFGMADTGDFPSASPYTTGRSSVSGMNGMSGEYLSSVSDNIGGMLGHQDVGDVDMDVAEMLNTEMEEDGNGQVTVVQERSVADEKNRVESDPGVAYETDQVIEMPQKPTGRVRKIKPIEWPYCHHDADISHTLYALDKLGPISSMSLTELFPQLTRSLEILTDIATCKLCWKYPSSTIPQLALLSRTCEILRHRHPLTPSPLPLSIAGGSTAVTGLAPEIEVHIVDVIWATWGGSTVQKICKALEKKARLNSYRPELAVKDTVSHVHEGDKTNIVEEEIAETYTSEEMTDGDLRGDEKGMNVQEVPAPETLRSEIMTAATTKLMSIMSNM